MIIPWQLLHRRRREKGRGRILLVRWQGRRPHHDRWLQGLAFRRGFAAENAERQDKTQGLEGAGIEKGRKITHIGDSPSSKLPNMFIMLVCNAQ